MSIADFREILAHEVRNENTSKPECVIFTTSQTAKD